MKYTFISIAASLKPKNIFFRISLILTLLTLCSLNSRAQYTKLFDFLDIPSGRTPNGSLISDGTFMYGMTSLGGENGFGTIFKIMPDGSNFIKILDFNGVANGREPIGSLYYDGTFLYGVTQKGGTNDFGTVFKILPDGNGFLKLKDFTGMPDGWRPKFCTLVSDGTYLYGTTIAGGTNDFGSVFKIKPDGSDYSIILNISGGLNGENIYGSLILDGTYLYGMTELGGSNGVGTIFKIITDGTGYLKLFDFQSVLSGSVPLGSLYLDGGYLYGMTSLGGTNNEGVIFKIMTDGTGFTKLLDFDGTNGGSPYGSLILQGTFLYGLTSSNGANNAGTLFKINTDGSGFVTIKDFIGTDGTFPFGSLITEGNFLYGMTSGGGQFGRGTIFKNQLLPTSVINHNQVASNPDDFYLSQNYPNPFNPTTIISFNIRSKSFVSLKIFDAMGKVVSDLVSEELPAGMYSPQWDAAGFASGVYFYQLQAGSFTDTKKLLLIR
ncbi:MAG TPA: T9SS type A sorting domain-containing protein [Ignavibacteria bacterium]|nr:T9SS type A sorting domain-containing protein [Ignavibacteria bacterium]HMR40212.1 T9SS type A sorting domain-containing protein [Ignavibacteria bacterium]